MIKILFVCHGRTALKNIAKFTEERKNMRAQDTRILFICNSIAMYDKTYTL